MGATKFAGSRGLCRNVLYFSYFLIRFNREFSSSQLDVRRYILIKFVYETLPFVVQVW